MPDESPSSEPTAITKPPHWRAREAMRALCHRILATETLPAALRNDAAECLALDAAAHAGQTALVRNEDTPLPADVVELLLDRGADADG